MPDLYGGFKAYHLLVSRVILGIDSYRNSASTSKVIKLSGTATTQAVLDAIAEIIAERPEADAPDDEATSPPGRRSPFASCYIFLANICFYALNPCTYRRAKEERAPNDLGG